MKPGYVPEEILHLLTTGVPWKQGAPLGVRPLGWARRGGRGLWRPIYGAAGASELAVLRPPGTGTQEVTISPNEGGAIGWPASALWVHGNSRTSGAGGAGQFSGVGDAYEPQAATDDLTQLEIAYLRLLPTVAAILRLHYDTIDIFGGSGDLANMASNDRSISDAPAGQPFGFEDWTTQTNTPDTTNIANHSARTTRSTLRPLQANVLYEWALTGVPLFSRVLVPDTGQNRAMGWGCWTVAVVTAITVDYTAIIHKEPE